MSDDGRDLAARLVVVDAEPQPGWVASLRADLGAAWETGELPSRIRVRATDGRRWRRPRPRWSGLVIAVAAVAAIVAIVVVPHDDERDIDIRPTITTTPRSVPPSVTTAPPTTSSPPTTTLVCGGFDPAAIAYITYTPTALWTVTPDDCVNGNSITTGFTIAETNLATQAPGVSRHVDLADIAAASPDIQLAVSDAYLEPWGNLALAGVIGRTVIMRTDGYIIGIDADTGNTRTVALPPPDMPPFETIFTTGVSLFSGGIFVSHHGDLMRADLATRTLERLDDPTLEPFTPQSNSTLSRVVPTAPEVLWGLAADGQTLARIDPDGSVHTTKFVDGAIVWLLAGTDSVWAIVIDDPTATFDPTDLQHPGHLVRLDPDTGEILAAPESPPGSAGLSFMAYPGASGILATNNGRAWWIDNDGNVTTLPPLSFDVLGVVGDRVVGHTAGNELVVVAIPELLDAAAASTSST